MDFNSYLRPVMVLGGVYDFYSRTFQVNKRKRQISYFCAAVNLFCSLKTICILVAPNPKTIFYLIDLHLVEGYVQRFFMVGVSLIHASSAFIFFYWMYLTQDVSRIDCFNFLFIPNLTDLCRHYALEKKPTQKFIATANRIRFLVYLLAAGFELSFALFVARCLVVAYLEIDFYFFLFLSVPLAIVTSFSLHCLMGTCLSMYCIMFTTQQFLVLRARTVSKKILNFTRKQPTYGTFFKQIRLRKDRTGAAMKIMATINSIVVQFEQANRILDNMNR